MSEMRAPFPYFGGKAKAAPTVWAAFGDVDNYVEPFAGSAAMLLAAPPGQRVETINDFDGFVSNFWRAISADPEAVAHWADWPCIEADLEARHAWLVNRADRLRWQLEDPDFYDPKIAGWWVWGMCNWIGGGWCSGAGPHKSTGARLYDSRKLPHLGDAGQGIKRQLPHLSAGRGINRQLPHLGNAGKGINRATTGASRGDYIRSWFEALGERLRDVRVACGDWRRVLGNSVTVRHGLTAVFLDPPYTKGDMDYGAGGMGQGVADDVRQWCMEHGDDPLLRIVLCGHAGEHDALLDHGWVARAWKAGGGYARSDEAVANRKSETLWCSPHCIGSQPPAMPLFDEAAHV